MRASHSDPLPCLCHMGNSLGPRVKKRSACSYQTQAHQYFASFLGKRVKTPEPVCMCNQEFKLKLPWRPRLESSYRHFPTKSLISIYTVVIDWTWWVWTFFYGQQFEFYNFSYVFGRVFNISFKTIFFCKRAEIVGNCFIFLGSLVIGKSWLKFIFKWWLLFFLGSRLKPGSRDKHSQSPEDRSN